MTGQRSEAWNQSKPMDGVHVAKYEMERQVMIHLVTAEAQPDRPLSPPLKGRRPGCVFPVRWMVEAGERRGSVFRV